MKFHLVMCALLSVAALSCKERSSLGTALAEESQGTSENELRCMSFTNTNNVMMEISIKRNDKGLFNRGIVAIYRMDDGNTFLFSSAAYKPEKQDNWTYGEPEKTVMFNKGKEAIGSCFVVEGKIKTRVDLYSDEKWNLSEISLFIYTMKFEDGKLPIVAKEMVLASKEK